MEMININVMGWTLNPLLQHHRRSYVRGKKYSLPIRRGYVYPFQIPRPASGLAIASFKIVNEETGEVRELAGEMNFQIKRGDRYDMIKYLGTTALSGEWREGLHYATMSDGQHLWTSDSFCMVNDVSRMIKLEWWHDDPIPYRDGCIDYGYPYRNYCYIDQDIGKPSYFSSNQVIDKNGVEERIRSTTWKEYNFEHIMPEYLADCLSRVGQHHHITIHHLGRQMRAEKFSMPVSDWEEYGALMIGEFSFRTGTVITTRQSSQAGGAGSGGANPSFCVDVIYSTNLTINRDQFQEATATNGFGIYGDPGQYVALDNGPIGIYPAGRIVVYQIMNDGSARLRLGTEGDVFFDLQEEIYYSHNGGFDGYILPGVISVVRDPAPAVNGVITANVIAGTQVELHYRTETGMFTLDQSFPAASFEGGLTRPMEGWVAIMLKFVSPTCGIIQESDTYFLDQPEPVALSGLDYTTVLGSYPLI